MSECQCLLVKPERIPDEFLWALIVAGEHHRFGEVVQRYRGFVGRIAYHFIRRNVDIEDAVQGTFLDIFKARRLFTAARAPFKVWLAMYARSRAIKHLRWLKRNGFYENAPATLVIQENRTVKCILARELLAILNPGQLRAIRLMCLGDFTAEEAAGILRDTVHATRHNYYRGLAKMREAAR